MNHAVTEMPDMPITIIPIVEERKYHVKISGQLTLGEIAVELDQLASKVKDTRNPVDILWDFVEADVPNISFDTMERLADSILGKEMMTSVPGKTVYLIDERAEKYLLSFLINRLETMGYRRKVCLLHDLQEAYQYLDFPSFETSPA
jgi:hypothetical protein